LYAALDYVTVTIRYDTIGEFNVDSKADYSALSSTRSQKKKLKQTTPVPLCQTSTLRQAVTMPWDQINIIIHIILENAFENLQTITVYLLQYWWQSGLQRCRRSVVTVTVWVVTTMHMTRRLRFQVGTWRPQQLLITFYMSWH